MFLFNHVSFGILIESLKLVFSFTEGFKFVNASTQIVVNWRSFHATNSYRLSVPTVYVQFARFVLVRFCEISVMLRTACTVH